MIDRNGVKNVETTGDRMEMQTADADRSEVATGTTIEAAGVTIAAARSAGIVIAVMMGIAGAAMTKVGNGLDVVPVRTGLVPGPAVPSEKAVTMVIAGNHRATIEAPAAGPSVK